jgi:hypothetical protein
LGLGSEWFLVGGPYYGWPPYFVYPEVEAYGAATDRWESYTPMPPPRHAPAVVAVADEIDVISGNLRTSGGSAGSVANFGF